MACRRLLQAVLRLIYVYVVHFIVLIDDIEDRAEEAVATRRINAAEKVKAAILPFLQLPFLRSFDKTALDTTAEPEQKDVSDLNTEQMEAAKHRLEEMWQSRSIVKVSGLSTVKEECLTELNSLCIGANKMVTKFEVTKPDSEGPTTLLIHFSERKAMAEDREVDLIYKLTQDADKEQRLSTFQELLHRDDAESVKKACSGLDMDTWKAEAVTKLSSKDRKRHLKIIADDDDNDGLISGDLIADLMPKLKAALGEDAVRKPFESNADADSEGEKDLHDALEQIELGRRCLAFLSDEEEDRREASLAEEAIEASENAKDEKQLRAEFIQKLVKALAIMGVDKGVKSAGDDGDVSADCIMDVMMNRLNRKRLDKAIEKEEKRNCVQWLSLIAEFADALGPTSIELTNRVKRLLKVSLISVLEQKLRRLQMTSDKSTLLAKALTVNIKDSEADFLPTVKTANKLWDAIAVEAAQLNLNGPKLLAKDALLEKLHAELEKSQDPQWTSTYKEVSHLAFQILDRLVDGEMLSSGSSADIMHLTVEMLREIVVEAEEPELIEKFSKEMSLVSKNALVRIVDRHQDMLTHTDEKEKFKVAKKTHQAELLNCFQQELDIVCGVSDGSAFLKPMDLQLIAGSFRAIQDHSATSARDNAIAELERYGDKTSGIIDMLKTAISDEATSGAVIQRAVAYALQAILARRIEQDLERRLTMPIADASEIAKLLVSKLAKDDDIQPLVLIPRVENHRKEFWGWLAQDPDTPLHAACKPLLTSVPFKSSIRLRLRQEVETKAKESKEAGVFIKDQAHIDRILTDMDYLTDYLGFNSGNGDGVFNDGIVRLGLDLLADPKNKAKSAIQTLKADLEDPAKGIITPESKAVAKALSALYKKTDVNTKTIVVTAKGTLKDTVGGGAPSAKKIKAMTKAFKLNTMAAKAVIKTIESLKQTLYTLDPTTFKDINVELEHALLEPETLPRVLKQLVSRAREDSEGANLQINEALKTLFKETAVTMLSGDLLKLKVDHAEKVAQWVMEKFEDDITAMLEEPALVIKKFWEWVRNLNTTDQEFKDTFEELWRLAGNKLQAVLKDLQIAVDDDLILAIMESFNEEKSAALDFFADLTDNPKDAVLGLATKAADLGLGDLAEGLQKHLKSALAGGLTKMGITGEVADKFAQGVGAMSPEEVQAKLEAVSAEADKVSDPKDMFEFIWAHVAGSAASQAMGSMKGFVKTRCLPMFDLFTDISVAISLTLAANAADPGVQVESLTGSLQSDAMWAWTLLLIPWGLLTLCVAISITRSILYFFQTGCGKRMDSRAQNTNEASEEEGSINTVHRRRTAEEHHFCDNCGTNKTLLHMICGVEKDSPPRICFCSNRGGVGQAPEVCWWGMWWWLVIIAAGIPAIVVAPAVIVFCELYLILLHPDGSVAHSSFVATYENLREVIEAIFESLPQALFQLALVVIPVMKGGEFKLDPLLLVSSRTQSCISEFWNIAEHCMQSPGVDLHLSQHSCSVLHVHQKNSERLSAPHDPRVELNCRGARKYW